MQSLKQAGVFSVVALSALNFSSTHPRKWGASPVTEAEKLYRTERAEGGMLCPPAQQPGRKL